MYAHRRGAVSAPLCGVGAGFPRSVPNLSLRAPKGRSNLALQGVGHVSRHEIIETAGVRSNVVKILGIYPLVASAKVVFPPWVELR